MSKSWFNEPAEHKFQKSHTNSWVTLDFRMVRTFLINLFRWICLVEWMCDYLEIMFKQNLGQLLIYYK